MKNFIHKIANRMKLLNNKRTYYLGMLINMFLYPDANWTTSKKEIIKCFIKGGSWSE